MKKLLSILLFVSMVFTLIACGGAVSSTSNDGGTDADATEGDTVAAENVSADSDYSIGFIFLSLTDTSLIRIKEDCEAKCKELGINFIAVDSASDSATQIDEIENMLARGVDAIIIQAVDTEAVTPYLRSAMDQGVKVVAFGIETEVYDVWYRNDPEIVGEAVAKMATEWANDNLDGNATIGILGYPQMANFIIRVDSARAYIADNLPGATIVAEESALGTEEAITAVENMLQANPDINMVITFSDGAALGANEAFKSFGKSFGEAAVFGSDISASGAEVILNGEFYIASTDISSLVLGETAIQICVDLLDGTAIDNLTGNNELVMEVYDVTAANAGDYVD